MNWNDLWAIFVLVAPQLGGFFLTFVVSFLKKDLATSQQKVWLTVGVMLVAAAVKNWEVFLSETAWGSVLSVLETGMFFLGEATLLYKGWFEDSPLEQKVLGKLPWFATKTA